MEPRPAESLIVTSALPYANGPIHFGHLVGAYLPADIFVRYRRLRGDDVHFVSGTDEHGVAITLKAENEGVAYADYVDRWHDKIKATMASLDIEFDVFSGTAAHRNPFHRDLAQQMFSDLLEGGYMVEKTEEQFYAPSIDRFLPDRYVEGTCYLCGYEKARGDECPNCGKFLEARKLKDPRSTLDGTTPELRATTHWYLDLSRIRDEWFRDWFDGKKDAWKPNVGNFVRGDLDELRERSMTRDLPWGVPVPVEGADGKVLYVWFDAPIGYLSISKQYWHQQGQPERFDELWKSSDTKLFHFIGKDNITFHCVTFPCMLHASGRDWILPENVPANEFFNLEGGKFNTSAKWFIPEEALEGVPADVLRYALCTMMPETADSDWTWAEFQSRVNADLADSIGNFVTRTLRFIERFFDGTIPDWPDGEPRQQDMALLQAAADAADEYCACLDKFQFRKSCQVLMQLASKANTYYDAEQPWVSKKSDMAACGATMRTCCESIVAIAALMSPILPRIAGTILNGLGLESAPRLEQLGRPLLPQGPIEGAPLTTDFPKFQDAKGNEKTSLFTKIDDALVAREQERLDQLRNNADTPEAEGAQPEYEPVAETMEFETFLATDMRAGTITEAEKHPKADRLLVLTVDLGFETRTIVSGIAGSYAPEELVGRRVVAVANLAPRKLRGIASQGMLLATTDADGKPRLTAPGEGAPNGARVS